MPKITKNVKKSLIGIMICLLFVVLLICANYLSMLLISPTEKASTSLSSNPLSVYAISLARSPTSLGAESLASDYRKIGSGGFVLEEEDGFHVISSAYLNKSDAELVKNSIEQNQNIQASIIEFSVPQISVSLSLDNKEKKVLQKALNAHENAYRLLFDIALSLDTNVYNEISARLAINSAFSEINTIVSDYKILFDEVEALNTFTEALDNLANNLQKLCSGITITSGQTLSSLVKYRYCEILQADKVLCENFNVS